MPSSSAIREPVILALIGSAAATHLTPCSFELGGKSPLIVCADADLELALSTAAGQYDNAGQVCLAGSRLLVHASVGVVLALTLPTGRYLVVEHPVGWGIIGAGVVVAIGYMRRERARNA